MIIRPPPRPANRFDMTRIRRVRQAAMETAQIPDQGPVGWSRSDVDPLKILACFPALRLKRDFTLHAYQYRDGEGNGNGVVWAVPTGAVFTSPVRCEVASPELGGVPRPPGALDDFMAAMDGDGSPWSYVCASLLARELRELGALWHGSDWSDHSIIGAPPWDRPAANDGVHGRLTTDFAAWTVVRESPRGWRPSVVMGPHGARVRFITYATLGIESIVEHLDAYEGSDYSFATTSMLLAETQQTTIC